MLKQRINLGVIGAGGRGKLALHAHDPENNVYLTAAADIDENALIEFKNKYGPGVLVTKDYKDILQDKSIDAVFITSPDYLHKEHAAAALQAKKHVYLEKPMAINVGDCDQILQTAYENKVKLFLGHNMRYMAFVLKMKELIDAGAIGEVKAGWCRHFIAYGGDAYFKDWHADREKSTGLLLQKAAHDIDILHWLCRGYTIRVNAFGTLSLYDKISNRHTENERGDATFNVGNWPPLSQKQLNPIINVEDLSMMQMVLDNGVLACYQQCHYTPDAWRNYTIIGTEGRIENFGDEPGNCVVCLWNKRTSYKPHGDQQYRISSEDGSHGGADKKIVGAFIKYLRNGTKINMSAIAARNSVAAGYYATLSLRQGGVSLDVKMPAHEIMDYFKNDANIWV